MKAGGPQDSIGGRPDLIRAVPVGHPWRWVSAVAVLAVAAVVIHTIVTAPFMNWAVVNTYLFQDLILRGIVVTLELTVVAMAIGISLGATLAVMRLSPNPVISWISWLYIWFFRGTPALVQIFFWYNLNIVLPYIGLGIPGTQFRWEADTNQLISPFLAVGGGLGLNEAAYMAEIVRAGIISLERGQIEAAQALGMTRLQVMLRIILPQAIRVIIPPTGNETIGMLKGTSLAFVAAEPELFTTAQNIAGANFAIVELLIVASLWYLVLTSVLTVGQYYLERHFARGVEHELPLTPFQRFRRLVLTIHGPPPSPFEGQVAAGPTVEQQRMR
jgi:polar amino acid transport system permease protein